MRSSPRPRTSSRSRLDVSAACDRRFLRYARERAGYGHFGAAVGDRGRGGAQEAAQREHGSAIDNERKDEHYTEAEGHGEDRRQHGADDRREPVHGPTPGDVLARVPRDSRD